MRTRTRLLATLWLLVPVLGGCEWSNRSAITGRTTPESARSDDRERSLSVLSGQLRSVDPDRKALIVAFEDDLYEFLYTDDTEVVGGTEQVQGLSGSRGSLITVHYRESAFTSTKTAVRIEITRTATRSTD